MRIIDKNTDFYDFWKNVYPDNTVIFDRTDSFVLTKDLMREHLNCAIARNKWVKKKHPEFLLLQVCNRFWLFLVETAANEFGMVKDYSLELLRSWENFGKKRALISLDCIRFTWSLESSCFPAFYGALSYDVARVRSRADSFVQAVNNGDYQVMHSINSQKVSCGDGKWVTKHIPLLIACGIGNLVDSHEMYLAIEQYFLMEKSASERTESIGLTDIEKVGNHGFDTKTSFRGKATNA